MAQQSRRQFLKLGSNVAVGLTLSPLACKLLPKKEPGLESSLDNFGIQLYSVRDSIKNDPRGVLKQLAGFGYKQIESYEGSMGMFWGMSNTDFKKYMDELGMVLVSSHCDINKGFEKKAGEAAAIGMKYLICPSVDEQKTAGDYKKLADQFTRCGEICKKAGIKFAYHNHDHDFKTVDGEIVQDIYLKNTDPSLVDFEMDIYWVVTAGQDPETWLKKYSNRFRLSHIKDRIKGSKERDASCILGTGSIDFPKILKTAMANGMQYYFVEQERYDNSTDMASAKADADYMKKLKF